MKEDICMQNSERVINSLAAWGILPFCDLFSGSIVMQRHT